MTYAEIAARIRDIAGTDRPWTLRKELLALADEVERARDVDALVRATQEPRETRAPRRRWFRRRSR